MAIFIFSDFLLSSLHQASPQTVCMGQLFKKTVPSKLYIYLLISEPADANQGVRKQFIKSTFQIDRDVKRKHKIR